MLSRVDISGLNMKLKFRLKLPLDDVVAHTVTIAEILKSTSDAVPFLGPVVGAALGVLSTIEKVRGNRERCNRLVKRISDLVTQVADSAKTDQDLIHDARLTGSLTCLQTTLDKIQKDLEQLLLTKDSMLSRVLCHASVSHKLDECTEALEDVSRSFTIECFVALRAKMALEARYDDQQLRFLRFCDLTLTRKRDAYFSPDDAISQEWNGEWEGRAVIIRLLRPEGSTEAAMKSLIAVASKCHYPYIAQLLGRSHVSIREKFYVLERGSLDVTSYATKIDPSERLRWYLQMFIDYDETFNYLKASGFPIAQKGESHTHNNCLSRISLRADGTLLMSAEDLVHANLGCLSQAFSRRFGSPVFETDRSLAHSVAHNPRALLSVVDRVADQAAVESHLAQLYDAGRELGTADIWCLSWYKTFSRVQIGDFGFEDPESHEFVHLGNIFEIIRRSPVSSWHLGRYRAFSSDAFYTEEFDSDYVWTDRSWSFDIECDEDVQISIGHQIARNINALFYWYFAYDIAVSHQLCITDLLLVDTIACAWGLRKRQNSSSEGLSLQAEGSRVGSPPTAQYVYFQQSKLCPNGLIPSPAGHWCTSLSPRSDVLTDTILERIGLFCRTRVKCARLNDFQAELVSYFGQVFKQLNISPLYYSHHA